jgi:hypothetical protein
VRTKPVHNSSHLIGYVINEYLENCTTISTNGYQWNKPELEFLVTVYRKKKYTPCSKKEAQQHILDKKVHGRNIKKGNEEFNTLCLLCASNDETQTHLLLSCNHLKMVYWRKDYFQSCKEIIASGNDVVPREYLSKLWEWLEQPEDELDDTIINSDNRRVGIMMGIPQKEDLDSSSVEGLVVKAGEQKSMQKLMTKLWGKSIEYAIVT